MNHNEKQHIKVEIAYSEKRRECIDVAEDYARIEIHPRQGERLLRASVQIPMVDIITRWFPTLSPGLARNLSWAETLPFGAQKNFPVYVLLNYALKHPQPQEARQKVYQQCGKRY